MKLLIGLGNPGKNYEKNRHNVGQRFADWVNSEYRILNPGKRSGQDLNSEFSIQNSVVRVLKTDCFMNDSGRFVKKAADSRRLTVDQLYIIHDDLDIPLGQFKIQFGVGPKVHNGVNSIEEALGTKDFWRIRIGVDNRNEGKKESSQQSRTPGERYVLEDFLPEEEKILEKVFLEILDKLKELI